MVRWIFGIGALLLVGFVVVRVTGVFETLDREKALRMLADEFAKAAQEAQSSAKGDNVFGTAPANPAVKPPDPQIYANRAIKIAGPNPTDKIGLECLSFAYSVTGGNDAQLVDLLTTNYAANPEVKPLVAWIATRGGAQMTSKLLEVVLDKNPDRDTRAFACVGLARLAFQKGAGTKGANKEAEGYLEQIVRDFPTVKLPSGEPLGEIAEKALFLLRNLSEGAVAPNAESRDLKGDKVQLKDYRGKVVVLDFWATWCGPCKQMIPHEREMVSKFKDRPFAFISISGDKEKQDLVRFLEKEPMPWTHWWDGDTSKLFMDWQIDHFPTIYVIDATGVIRYKEIRGEALERAIESLLDEMKKK